MILTHASGFDFWLLIGLDRLAALPATNDCLNVTIEPTLKTDVNNASNMAKEYAVACCLQSKE